ncbi:MAG: hypothetical protein GF393_02590, partial [Armatimonadia bacterium]|nr:hypothetical protein [Armatimonadia bacterium]
MRTAVITVCALIAVNAFAAEPWFLPYEVDEDTLLLLHLDAEGEEQPDAGPLDLPTSFAKGAESTEGVFGRAAYLDGNGQHIRVDDSDPLRFGVDEPFTIE